MQDSLLRLYPNPGEYAPLQGLYLDKLNAPDPDRLFVYSNYVVSLDGRIAVTDADTGHKVVPSATANPRDWRLFQELAAQADVLLTSGRYLRDLAAGRAQDILPVSPKPEFADLIAYRIERGMRDQPDIAVFSASLDVPIPAELLYQKRNIRVYVPADADENGIKQLEDHGATVIPVASRGRVCGREVVDHLQQTGYRRAYAVTGPFVLHTLVEAGALDSLFLTFAFRLLGGRDATTIMDGPLLERPPGFDLAWMYLDPIGHDAPQAFCRFDRRRETNA